MGSYDTYRQTDRKMILATLNLLHRLGDILELRILNTPKGTVSGYFNDFRALAKVAMQASGKVPAVYITLNRVRKDLLARSNNRVKTYVKTTTADADVIKRCWFVVDVDPVRPKDISSSDEEHQLALDRAKEIRAFLSQKGWPGPITADSGNGGHLLYKIDLPSDDEARELIKRCLEALDCLFTDDRVSVDTSVYNAARIWKLYGTLACKGDDVPERPHRLARLLEVPEHIEVVSLGQLKELAAMLPDPPKQERNFSRSSTPLDIERWLSEHGLSVRRKKAWQGGTVYELTEYPFNPEHNSGEARIIQFPSGALSFGCFHNSCRGRNWDSLRDRYEPGRGERREGNGWDHHTGSSERSNPQRTEIPYPKPLAPEAFHGLAGEFVKTMEPHTEADRATLLTNFLTAFGSVIGDGAHFLVEADKHPMRLFVAQVGTTSKGRKGTGWGHVKRLFETVDPQWVENIQSGLSSGEGLIWAVRDPMMKKQPVRERGRVASYEEVIVDDGVEDKRLLIMESEFASTLKVLDREGNILSAVIRNAWDIGNLQTLTKNSHAKATGAHISIIGHITKDELTRYLRSTEQGNGFANRFLYVCVQRSKALPFGGAADKINFEPLIKKMSKAVSYAQQVGRILWAEETRPLWADIYPELSEGKPGIIGAMTARAEAYVTRLACIYALLDLSDKIEPEHLDAARAVWDYAEASVKYIFQDSTGDPLANNILEVLMSKPGGMTRTEISNYFDRHKSSDEIAEALQMLEQLGLARKESIPTQGRDREVWYANKTQEQSA